MAVAVGREGRSGEAPSREARAPARLSDGQLVAEVARLAGCARTAVASLVAHLAELYGRRLHHRAGFSSLFTYCMEVLGCSEHEAYDRMKAARAAHRFPSVVELLASGRITLTTVRLLAPHLTRANHRELLAAACGKRKRQVQVLLAQRFPREDVPFSVRRLRAPAASSLAGAMASGVVGPVGASAPAATAAVAGASHLGPWLPVLAPGAGEPGGVAASSGGVVALGELGAVTAGGVASAGSPTEGTPMARALAAPAPPLIQPLAPDRYRVTYTTSAAACEKLELARDLLRHALPGGDAGPIVERALDLLIETLVKEKFAVRREARRSRRQADRSRNIPAEVKRAVYIRDRGRCAYVAPGGRRCGERAFVEFHHIEPYAVGGPPTVANISLRCASHNRYESELFYGPGRRSESEVSADSRGDQAPAGPSPAGGRARQAGGSAREAG